MVQKLEQFQKIFEGEFHFDNLHKMLYATDASVYRKLPLAVAFPKNNKAITQLIQFANKNKTSLIPRTAGTSLSGQCVGDGIIVDVSKHFTKILSVDEKNNTVRLQPGVIRDELNDYLQPFGLFFGPNTSTSNRCMIGGMVGNNSSGTTSIQYGVTRDKVIRLKTILSNGDEVIFEPLTKDAFFQKTKLDTLEGIIYKTIYSELNPKSVQQEITEQFPKKEIHRRNTGYALDSLLDTNVFNNSDKEINIASLLSGSEGTLAFTTEITLQLDPLPPQYSSMVIAHYASIENCLNDVLFAMEHNLYACEMMDDFILNCTKNNKKYNSYSNFVEGKPKALLMLELRSDTTDLLLKQTNDLLYSLKMSNLSYATPVLKEKEIEKATNLRKAGLGLLGNMVGDNKTVACVEDTAVALDDLPSYINQFTKLMKQFDQQAVYYAHAGAGELHLRPILNLKKEEGVTNFRKITTEVAKLTKQFKGSFSGEHGDGIVRGEFLPMLIGTSNYSLLKRIKKAFDPSNIFNSGKIVEAYKMDESLRYETNSLVPNIETLLDFSDSEGILRLAEKCNGSADCRKTEHATGTMCPSYHVTKDEKHTTRGRANTLREVLANNKSLNSFDSKELKEVFDLCLSCKACANECPSNVDIATAKAEFLYQYKKTHPPTFADKIFARNSYFNKKAASFPKLINALFKNFIFSYIIKKACGIALKRSLPLLSSKSFSKTILNSLYQSDSKLKKMYLFVDEFSNYLDSEIAKDSYDLLTRLGYNVSIIDRLDSGRALLSKGFLKEAKEIANYNIEQLKDKISKECPLIGIEPSAILSFRDEYLRLTNDLTTAKSIANNTYLIEEFLASEIKMGIINKEQFTLKEKTIKIHTHCHQKALSNQKVTFDILNLPVNYTPTIIPTGCCGMAGSFGFEKDHYALSMDIGNLKLFPSIRKTSSDIIIAANGTSCRHQILDGTHRKALHPASILKEALI